MQTGRGNGGQESIIEWECAVEQGRAPREHESFLFYQESISHSFTTKLQYEMSTGGGRAPRAKRAFFIILFKNIIRNAYWRGKGAKRAFIIIFNKNISRTEY